MADLQKRYEQDLRNPDVKIYALYAVEVPR